jgi:cysteine-rich repeat protein
MRIQFIVLLALVGCQDTATSTIRNQLGETCEEWEVDATPTQLFPVDHRLRTFTLDDCVTINECEPEPNDPICGNGTVEGTEQCDDANTTSGDGCNASCTLEVCGDGVVQTALGEQCDDGNTNPFDGCDRCILVDTTPDKRTTSEPTMLAPSSAATTLTITRITANEPIEVKRGGDGHSYGADAVIVDSQTFKLRAERQGRRRDRVYSVHFVDQDGNAGACTFVVPHDHGCGH